MVVEEAGEQVHRRRGGRRRHRGDEQEGQEEGGRDGAVQPLRQRARVPEQLRLDRLRRQAPVRAPQAPRHRRLPRKPHRGACAP